MGGGGVRRRLPPGGRARSIVRITSGTTSGTLTQYNRLARRTHPTLHGADMRRWPPPRSTVEHDASRGDADGMAEGH